MVTGIRLTNCKNCTFEVVYGEGITNAVNMTDSKGIHFPSFDAGFESAKDHQKLYANRVGRNELCPCGSGIKSKKCSGRNTMSTGIKSDNSTFTIGKARIVADVGIDMVNSVAHIDDYTFLSTSAPDLHKILRGMQKVPPPELISEAMSAVNSSKDSNVIQKSRLKKWATEQGLNASLWLQLSAAVAIAALGG